MICHFEGFSRAARGSCSRQNRLIHLQIRLKFQSVAGIPTLLAGEGGKILLLEGGSEFALCLRGDLCDALRGSFRGNFQSAGGHRQQGFALQQGQKIAIECGVDLETIAAVFNDIGIDKARNDALAEQGFAQTLS